MVAIVAGTGLGLERSSAWVLGSQGQLGQATLGRGGDNVYVNAASGNLIVQNTDEMLMGLGQDDPVVRTYNSLGAVTGAYSDDNGDGWRESVSRQVLGLTGPVNTAGTTVNLLDWDGSDLTFGWDTARNAYVSKQGERAYDTLTFSNATALWTFTDGATQIQETYDAANNGRITKRIDADGNALTFAYTAGGLVSQVTTQNGEYTSFTYSGSNLSQVQTFRHQAANGADALAQMTSVTYGYDTSNRLQTVKVDLTPGDNTTADGKKYTTTYGYDGTSKRVNSITQDDGSSLTLIYVLMGSTYRVQSFTQTAASGQTRVTSFSYDTTNLVTTITDPMSFVTQLAYDAAGQLTKITAPPARTGAAVQVTQFGYNAGGDVTSVIAPDGTTGLYSYDANGNRIGESDGAGVLVTRTFSASNLKLTETAYPTGGAGVTTRYVYDAENHLRFVITPLGEVSEYRYNAVGQQTTAINYLGATYSLSGLSASQSPAEAALATWAAGLSVAPTTQRTETAYDYRGNVSTVTIYEKVKADGTADPAGAANITYFTYDQAGRLLSKKTPTATYAQTFQYDGLGRVVASTDFANASTTIAFTDTGSSTAVTLANGLVQTSTYDLAGELISYSESGAGVATATTTYGYDADGRLRKVTDPSNTSSYSLYDNVGRKTADIAADGTIVEYAYNVDDQRTTTIRYRQKLTPAQITSLGNVAVNVDVATVRPSATADDRWDWKVYDATQRLVQSIDAAGELTSYTYDGASQLISTRVSANPIDANVLAGMKTPVGTAVFTGLAAGTPTTTAVSLNATAGSPLTFDPRAKAADPNGDVLAITAVSAPAHGTVTLNGGTSLTYTPSAGYAGADSVTYTLSDGHGGTVTATANFNVYFNDYPSLATTVVSSWSDTGTGVSFTPTVSASQVVISKTIGSSPPAQWGGQTQAGTAEVVASSAKWNVTAGEQLGIAFEAQGQFATNYITVSLHYWDASYGAVGDSAAVTVPVGATWAQFSQIFAAVPAGAVHASLLIAQSATGVQTAPGTKYAVALRNAQFLHLTASQTMPTAAANTLPMAQNDSLKVATNTLVTFDPRANDSDLDTDSLTVQTAGTAAHGTVSFTGSSVSYTSVAGYTGADSFTYTISDGRGGTKTGTVNVTVAAAVVNTAPTATGVSLTANAGVGLTFDPRANAADANGDGLTITGVAAPGHGAASINAGGTSITYTPSVDYAGADSFTYTLSDAHGGTVTATATFNVYGYNAFGDLTLATFAPWSDPGTGVNYTTTVNPTYQGQGPALLIEKTLTASGADTTSGITQAGELAIMGASGDYWSLMGSDKLAVAFEVQGLNVTNSIYAYVHYWDENWGDLGNSAATSLSVNSSWAQFSQTFNAPANARHAMLVVAQIANGDQHAAGTKFGVAIRNPQFLYLTTAQTAPVAAVDTLPSAGADKISVTTNTPLTFDPRVNDADLDADALTISGATNGAHGTVAIIGGQLKYTPANGYTGADSFTYTIFDGRNGFKTATVTVAVGAAAQVSSLPTSLDQVVRNFYDADGRRVGVLDSEGYLAQTLYDAAGQTSHTVRYANAAAAGVRAAGTLSNLLASVGTSAADVHAWRLYDGRGLLRAEIDGEGALTRYAYDASGFLSQTIAGQKLNPASLVTTPPTLAGLPSALASEVLETTTYGRDAFGQVLSASRTQAGGVQTTTYQYDAMHRLIQTTTTLGGADARTSGQVFDRRGRLIKSLDGVGSAALAALGATPTQAQIDQVYATYGVSYVYDADDRLIQKIEPDGVGTSGLRSVYYYDDLDRLAYSINPFGEITHYSYNGFGEVIDTLAYGTRLIGAALTGLTGGKVSDLTATITANSQLDVDRSASYGLRGEVVQTVDPLGVITNRSYDLAGRLTTLTQAAGTAAEKVTQYSYDEDDRLISEVVDPGPSRLNLTTSYTYDNDGDVVAVTDPLGHVTRSVRDADGRVIYAIDAAGDVVQTTYSAAGHVVRTTRYVNPILPASLAALPLAATATAVAAAITTSASDASTNYVYDTAGYLAYQIDAAAHVTAYVYDAGGRVAHSTEYATAIATPSSYTIGAVQPLLATNADDRTTRYVYDADGRLAFTIDAQGSVKRDVYDAAGQLKTETRYGASYSIAGDPTFAAMTTWAGSHTSGNQVQSWAYDAAGRVTDWIDATSVQTHRVWDAQGRLTDETVAYGTANASTTHRDYDAAGRVLKVWKGLASNATSYSYDAMGRVKTITDPNLHVTARSYDAAGRLLAETVDPGNGALNLQTGYQYDAAGNRVKVTDPNGAVGYFYYDAANRLILQVDPVGYATRTDYDSAGQLAKVTRYWNPTSGATVTTQPTITTNAAKDAVTTFTRDKLERLTETKDAEGYSEKYELNGFGDVWRLTNKLTGVTTKLYDHVGRLASESRAITWTTATGTAQSQTVTTTYQYDPLGNRFQMIEAQGSPDQRTTNYGYDLDGRLTDESTSVYLSSTSTAVVHTKQTQYDQRGNAVKITDGALVPTYTYYDLADRKIAQVAAVDPVDGLGSLTQWTYYANGDLKTTTTFAARVAPTAAGGAQPGTPSGASRQTAYVYDAASRLISTAIDNVLAGRMSDAGYLFGVTDILNQTSYDPSGNVRTVTDGNGGVTFFYYDYEGRRTAKIDAGGFLTTYQLDAEGRVRVETAFATPATSFSLATYTAPAASADDRITTSDYDRNGNLLSQARSGVQASSVAANGALTTATATATVSYSYDALGDVIAKTDANNAVTLQKYDSFGRQIRVLQQAYLDYRGVSVTPTTETSYNGLDLVTQTIARGDGTTSAGDRTTTYVYGAGGRLVSVTDPVGLKKTFTYDQVGRETIEQYDRKKSDTTTTETDGVSIVYDAAGREISRKAGVLNGTVWAYGDTQDLFYDGFGDLIARGANTGGQIANAQEFADHDNAGRVWRTNFGDGVTKAYAYDLNGNATALLQGDGGIDLRAKTDLAAVLNDTTGKISITMSAYDTRNELIDTKQPQSNNLGASPVHAVPVDVTGAGTQYFNANVGLSDAAGIVGTGAVSTTLQSASVVAASGGGVVTFQHTSRDTRQLRGSYPIFTDNYTVTIPNNQIADLSGGGSIHVVVTDTFGYSNTIDYAPGTLVLPFSIGPMRLSGERIATIVVMEDLGTGLGQRLIAQATLSGNNTTPVQVALPAEILIRNENPAATVLRLFARIYGTAGPYVAVNTSQVVNAAGAAVAGWYTVDMSQPPFNGGTPNTTWEVKYLALDAAGNILDSREGQIATSGGYANTNFWAGQVGGPGQVMITRNGTQDWVIFSGILPAGATQARLRYRPAGSNGAWSGYIAVGNNAYGQPGLFGTQITGIVGTQEFWLETLDGAGNVVGDRRYGQFTAGGQAPAMGAYRPSSKQVLLTPLSGTTTQKFRYLTSGGSWSAWSTLNSGGQWSFDGSAIVPDFLSTTTTSYEYDNYNGSTPISHTTGTLTLGFAGQSVTMNAGVSAPAKVQFSPLQSNAASITVYWRDKDSIGPFYKAVVPKSGGTFGWDVDAAGVRPTSGTHNIEYYYDAYDGNGTLLPPLNGDDHMHGYIAIQSNQYALTDDFQIQWVVDFNDASRFLIDRKQKFNAFGEIKSETDGRGNVTTFDYNTLGKLITKTEPIVAVTSEAGVTANVNPVENYYYDLGGRLVAQQDANGNILKQTLLTGSGQGGAGALTLKEFHPDGGAKAFGYDVFGDLRTSTDELNAVTAYDYDNASRLSEVDHAARTSGNSVGTQLKDYYLYDVLGERTRHWNSQLGSTVVETTDYDAQQRVTQTVTFGGLTTAYAYQWLGAAGGQLSTAGLGNFGGWQTTTTEASGLTHSEKADVFGHTVSRLDLGAHSYAYTYNLAGELLHQSNSAGQSIDYTYYTNGYIASVTDNVLHMLSTFEYDNDGNRTLETYNNISNATIFYQNAVVSYDALNRVTEFKDAKADITYAYDANGNRREVKSVYHDGLNGAMQTQDYWYKYDGMNRFVLTMGTLSGGQIGVGTTGVAINYNAAGERATATYSGANPHTETYSYSADGYLENTTIAGVVRASRTNDAMGRMTSYVQNTAANATDMSRTNIQYDGDNRIVSETDLDVTNGNVTTTVTNDYKALVGSAYTGADQGVITHTKSVRSSGPTTDTTYSYVMWDEAKQSGIQIKGDDPNNPNSYKWASGFSQLTYDVNGHLLQAIDNTYQLAGKTVQRVLTYQSDAYGQVLVREEKDAGVLGPRQLYYYFNGHRIGDVGNNGPNPSLEDYAQELAEDRSKTQTGGFRFGHPVASADFDENYQPINSSYPLGAASAYTVRTGDTLRSIALSLWGDDSLWYLIAEANGLGASTLLVAGQTLSIPNKVTNLHNTSSTFRVYNPGEAIGDALPTLPPEPKPPHASCFAQIVLAVISFAVAWYMPVLLPALGPVLSTVVTAAAANVVSQGIGVATGLQDHFSWRDVAVSALTAGVIQGVGGIPGLGSGLSGAIVRGAVSNVLTQGVEVAVGLQRRFDWASVAADAIGSGAGYEAGVTLDKTFGTNTFGTDAYQPRDPKNFGTNLGSAAAYAVASSATRSLINGSSFGTNLGAALPGVIGSTIGNLVAGRMADDRSARMDAMLGGVDRAEARIAAGNPGSYEVADLGGTGKSQPGLLSRIWGDIKEAGAWLGDLTGITDGHIGLGQSSLKINSPPPDGTTVSELVVTARHPLAAADAANRYGYYLASAAHDGRSINRASALTTYNQYQGQLRYIVAQPRTTPEERNAALGASQYLFQGANAAGLRGVTQLPFSSGPYAVASMAFGGGGPSPRLMMNTGEISLGPSAAPKILQAPSGAIVELPAQASLSRADARSWYVSQDANIPNLIDRSATLEQQAYQASGLRNAFRSTSRDSMVNFSVANDLNLTRPNLTWQQTVQKYNGDYAEIISASQRSNRQVNSQFNINP